MSSRRQAARITFFTVVASTVCDLSVTWAFTPDLAHEGNPIVRTWRLGWGPLLALQLAVLLVFALVLRFYASGPRRPLAEPAADVWRHASLRLYGVGLDRAGFLRRFLTGWPLPADGREFLRLMAFMLCWAGIAGRMLAVVSWIALYGLRLPFYWTLRHAVSVREFSLLEPLAGLLAAAAAIAWYLRSEFALSRPASPR